MHTKWNNCLCPTSPLCRCMGRGFESPHSTFFAHWLSEHCQQLLQTEMLNLRVRKNVCGPVGSNGGSMVNGVVERLTRNGQPFMFLLTLYFVFLGLWVLLDTPSCSDVDSLELDRSMANRIPALRTIIQWRQTNVMVWKSSVEDRVDLSLVLAHVFITCLISVTNCCFAHTNYALFPCFT